MSICANLYLIPRNEIATANKMIKIETPTTIKAMASGEKVGTEFEDS